MDELLGTIGDAIGSVFSNPVVTLAFQIILVYGVLLWIAAAYWAFRDLQLRTDNPLAPYFAAAFIIVFTPVLFPLAVFAYRIVRPQERVGEIYERNLAEEAMLAEIEAIRHCPQCARRVDAEWIICPTCRTRLNRVCPNCTKLVGLDWSLCAWCGRDFERPELVATATPIVRTPTRGALPEPSARRAMAAPLQASVRSSAAASGAGAAAARNPDPLTES